MHLPIPLCTCQTHLSRSHNDTSVNIYKGCKNESKVLVKMRVSCYRWFSRAKPALPNLCWQPYKYGKAFITAPPHSSLDISTVIHLSVIVTKCPKMGPNHWRETGQGFNSTMRNVCCFDKMCLFFSKLVCQKIAFCETIPRYNNTGKLMILELKRLSSSKIPAFPAQWCCHLLLLGLCRVRLCLQC